MRLPVILLALALPMCAADTTVFENSVRPLLVSKCHSCHSGKSPMANVDLSTAAGAKAAAPRLAAAVSYEGKIKMPPNGRLKDAEIAALKQWAAAGAEWPQTSAAGSHWAFQPRKAAAPPQVTDSRWARNDVDRFLLHRLEAQSLKPAPPADKLTLLRRVTFDLTGLPPSEREIADFQSDASPEAFDRVVERLLASPRYGEHWGRHWMDVARYADSTGADEDHRYPHAWRYRDYVIDAFNRDLPYNEFIREQVAGDLLPLPGGGVNTRGIVATGFLALGPKLIAEQDKVKMFYDIVDEQIEVTGKAFLGLTLACARCHDHKFDPVSTKDYYSLASIFASTKQLSKLEGTVSQLYFAPLVDRETAARWDDHQKKVEAKQKQIDGVIGQEQARYRRAHLPKMAEYMLAARRVYVDGKTTAEAAAGLDPWVVEQWAKYLKPTGERRHHLEEWDLAHAGGLESAARGYYQRYLATEKFRADARERWKRESEAAKARGEKAPPEPKFLAGDDRFFSEVNLSTGPFKMPEENRESLYSEDSRSRLAALRPELETLKKSAPPEPPLACAVGEGEAVEQHVFVRGNPEAKGDAVAKALPRAIAGDSQPPIRSGSGRRELAAWLADANNPLTARVMVNRIWQWHFGEGLVRTPNNFGKLGAEPTHPELLDWLAQRFIDSGWSMKAMHRLILGSNAYRMSSLASKQVSEADAENRLLTRFPTRRLAVEEIRDSLLLLDGTLDLAMGGKMMEGTGTDKEFADARKTLDPDKTPRRLVYLPLRRSNLPSLLNLFDFGDATTSNEGRTQTNVAPQALYMMNSAFVEDRAQNMAKALLAEAADDGARIRSAHLKILNRPADAAFVDAALTYLARFPGGDKAKAWTSFTRTLIASNDFLYVH